MLKLTPKKPHSEIWGIVFLCFLAFVVASLLSYDPKDPSFNSVSSAKEVQNWTGVAGSYTADLLLQTFGLSAYLLIFPIFLLTIYCFFPTAIYRKGIRLFSFGLLIIFFSGLSSLSLETISIHDQKLLAGGLTGHLLTSLFLPYFNPVGSYIILIGGFVSTIILSFNVSLVSALRLLGSGFVSFFSIFSGFKSSRHIFGRKKPDRIFSNAPIIESNSEITDPEAIPSVEVKEVSPMVIEAPSSSEEYNDEFSQDSPLEEEMATIEEVAPPRREEETVEPPLSPEIIIPEAPQQKKNKSRGSDPNKFPLNFLSPKGNFKIPNIDLLSYAEEAHIPIDREIILKNSRILEQKFKNFNVDGRVVEVRPGPVITVYEFEPAPGVKVSKIVNLADDLALALSALSVRIVAPIPGKSVVGIELPNEHRQIVSLKGILQNNEFKSPKYRLPLPLGKSISGDPIITDLARMPHLLVAGATGAGKSVFLNSIICSFLFRYTPDHLRFLLIDPKMLELSMYDQIPHLLLPVVTDPKKAALALKWAVQEMDRRYALMSKLLVRNIDSYNKKIEESSPEELDMLMREESLEAPPEIESEPHDAPPESFENLPYIIIVIDELADLMIVSSKDVELSIARLAQMARAAGIHLLVATQRPSVDVLTGLIKANFSARIAFQVASKVDSRTILDTMGAEKLLGNGDMLYSPPGTSKVKRVHGAYVSDQEVKKLVEFLKKQGQPHYDTSILSKKGEDDTAEFFEEDNDLYQEAIELVSKCRYASISMIQRRLRIGYNRAARMIEQMEIEGIVGPSDGAKPREVLIKSPDERLV